MRWAAMFKVYQTLLLACLVISVAAIILYYGSERLLPVQMSHVKAMASSTLNPSNGAQIDPLAWTSIHKQLHPNPLTTPRPTDDIPTTKSIAEIHDKFSDTIVTALNRQQRETHELTMPLRWSTVCMGHKFVVVVITSAPRNLQQRQTIRDSWEKAYEMYGRHEEVTDKGVRYHATDVIKAVFLLGSTLSDELNKDLKMEARKFEDIVAGPFIDSYANLTYKTVLGLKWAHYYCNARYVLKTDDDVFINTLGLVKWLQPSPRLNFYSGYCNRNSVVVRDKASKWYVSEEQYPKSVYPQYCLGGGYVMSSDVLSKVVREMFTMSLFPMEDLHVGLIIDRMEGIRLIDQRHRFQLIYQFTDDPCQMRTLILAHPVTAKMQDKMHELWKSSLSEC